MAAGLVKSAGAEGFTNRLSIGMGDVRKCRESVGAQQRGEQLIQVEYQGRD